MKSNRLLLFMWAMLAALVLIAVSSFMETAPKYVGKSYVDTPQFQSEMDAFYSQIGPAVLNPLDREEAIKSIQVTREEIEEHRNRYGSLGDQISDIQGQYMDRIAEAAEAKNKVLEESLTKERDNKIEDIQKNFENDTHVEEKIRTEKTVAIDHYLESIKDSEARSFPIYYKFTDVKNGETFSSGNIESSEPEAYQKSFNTSDGLYKASSIPSNDSNMNWFDDGYSMNAIGPSWGDEYATESSSDIPSYKNPIRTFEGLVIVPKAALTKGALSAEVKDYNKRKYSTYTIWLLGILAAVALFTVLKFKKEWVLKSEFTARYNRLKIDLKAVIVFLTLLFTVQLIHFRAVELFGFYYQYNTGIWAERIFWLIALAVAVAFIAFQLVNIVERLKHKGMLEEDIKNSYTLKFFLALQDSFVRKTIGMQTFLLLIGFFLAGIGFMVVAFQPMLIIVYIPLVVIFALPILYIFVRRSAYLNRIIHATEAMANGTLHEPIPIEGKSPLADHAVSLNNLREGVRSSMSEQAKSERLKTELITNVSHDLRTPLTSIITYTDLLKGENISAEERAKYVDIIDAKSQRLKTLIEDLFEVSKMASGNLELNKQRVDLTQLLQQALAEHEEEIVTSGLDFRTTLPETALIAFVDGQRWWRVLDNLILNAIKYTMPGTRVYITLRKVGGTAEFIVKNVTKYELGENVDELFERFKRADTSRHTEGSGLGLAIAQSIVDMHGGNMKVELDGDLFKVTVEIPTNS
ncbi:histidine kinase dimerization/phospho-acceptor domain-containing protein [Sporosarcina siberiensis]|uniref:histidine kinase n=1 Tax=Sporosarcina siberiensis TaxID=1365606 RepID=A0ABW4SD37_9BACL